MVAIAITSLAFNYILVYNDKKEHLEQDMRACAKSILSIVNTTLRDNKQISEESLKAILGDYDYNTPIFVAFVNSSGTILASKNLPLDFDVKKYMSNNSTLTSYYDDDKNILMEVELKTPEKIVLFSGFTQKTIGGSIFNETLYISIWVLLCVLAYLTFVAFYSRTKIEKPLKNLFKTNMREFVNGILASSVDCNQQLKTIEKISLPNEFKEGMLEAFEMLQKWSCYKVHFEEFLSMTVAESNKEQLVRSLFLAIQSDFFVKNITVLEINHSMNRFEPITSGDFPIANICTEESMADPSACVSYRTGNRVTVEEARQSVCAFCKAEANETILCKPMMACGKQIGVVKLTLDNAAIMANDTINGYLETKIKFLESYIKPYIDLASLTISNINMLNAYKNQALTDALTGLYNRRYITEYLYNLLNIAKRKESFLSIFMIDIDNFKHFNDEYGHKIGDSVLKVVAQTIKNAVRDGDTVARYGGEEFIVVLPYSDLNSAYEVGERVRSRVESIEWSEYELAANVPRVTISLGIAAYPVHGYSHYHLTNAADKALYKAKHAGKNMVITHEIKEREV